MKLNFAREDFGHSGEHVDVSNPGDRVEHGALAEERRALGDVRHMEDRGGDPRPKMSVDGGLELGAAHQGHAEAEGDALHGDVVVGGADASGAEDVVIGLGHGLYLAGDLAELIADDRHPHELDPEGAQLADQEAGVLFFDLPGEDLVTDDDDPGGRHPGTSPHRGQERRGLGAAIEDPDTPAAPGPSQRPLLPGAEGEGLEEPITAGQIDLGRAAPRVLEPQGGATPIGPGREGDRGP